MLVRLKGMLTNWPREVASHDSIWFRIAPQIGERPQSDWAQIVVAAICHSGFRSTATFAPPAAFHGTAVAFVVALSVAHGEGFSVSVRLTNVTRFESDRQRGERDVCKPKRSKQMKIALSTLRAMAPAFIAAAAVVVAGCSESTTKKDVAEAQKDLNEARQNTQEAVREGQQDIAATQRDARDHVVNKPVTPDQAADPRNDVADARVDANQNIADAKEKERAAAAELRTAEQKAAATQERDAFVKQAEQSLADYDKRIEELEQQASSAEGATKDAIDRQIDAVKGQRDRAASALNDLKNAELATWKNHQDHVRMAFQDLDNSMKNVR
jgi:DNA repair exonuclease SbcCD ATPase subunit